MSKISSSKWLVMLTILCLSPIALWADFFVPAAEFSKMGVDYAKLEPVNLAYNGEYFVALEIVTDVKVKAEGVTRILRLFRFNGNKIAKVESAKIPITHRVNAAVSDRKPEVFIVGNYGTKIVRVDLTKMQVDVPFQFKKGEAGFKSQGFLFCANGAFYATGEFYDNEQYWTGDAVAKLEVNKDGKIKPILKYNTDEVFKSFKDGMVQAFYHVSGDQVFFNLIKPEERKTYLMLYKNKKITEIDKGELLNIFVGCENSVFYTVKNQNKQQHFVKNLTTQKAWQIGTDNAEYTYPFMSDKGDILIVITITYSLKTLDAYYGKRQENYKLKRFLRRASLGPMKMSADGRTFMIMTKDGYQYGELK